MDITIEKLYEAVMELKEEIGIVKNEIVWIKKSIETINDRQSKCVTCNNSEYIKNQTETSRNDIEYLKKQNNITIGISMAGSSIASIIVTLIILGIIKLS